MLKILAAVFLVLHALVHLLYFGQSQRIFELQPGLTWPDGSWAFSKLLGAEALRRLAGVALVLAGLAFLVGAAAVVLGRSSWQPVTVAAAGFSALLYLLFWNGTLQRLDGQGAVGLLIDAAILASLLWLRWPRLGF
jgi:hypothetical protein